MGAIHPHTGHSTSPRKIVMLRTKVFEQLRQQYLDEGKPLEEATALALLMVRETRFPQ